ncbi:hypothetical protein BH10PSE5_BH10PSE5_01390 [soil metagenome]
MTDILDRAQLLEESDRADALRRALQSESRPDVVFSVLACLDCDDPIDDARMAARPGCVRCITCQEAHERRLAQFRS